MTITKMTAQHIEQIRHVAAITWAHTYHDFIPAAIQQQVLADAYSDEEMTRRIKNDFNIVFLIDNDVVGYAFFLMKEDVLFLQSLYIHPAHHRKGIGQQLLQAAVTQYPNASTIALTVYKGNTSIAFYEKLGFTAHNETNGDFFGHAMTFIHMKKDISDFI